MIVGFIIMLLVGTVAWNVGGLVWAQTVGEEAEMERLRTKAEDAIASDDPEGAAMSMGRAALMASELAKRQSEQVRIEFFHAAEALFRAQEHAYRGLALFRRAGSQAPASAGVCGSLQLSQLKLQQALKLLTGESVMRADDPPFAQRLKRLQNSAEDWVTVLASMQADFQCL